MLWRLDHQEAVDISSIPDQDLLKLLQLAFDNLKLLKVKEVSSGRGKTCPSLLHHKYKHLCILSEYSPSNLQVLNE